ncbi:MAG: ROK family protein, partial [Chloroflexi bacterium]|nr:ROK family protein [Chloroflexota bacterium]
VDSSSGVLRLSPFFGWRNVPIRNLLQSRLRVPIYVDNDVNTLTLSEKLFGAGQNVNNFLTVTLGRGVGMGIVVHGELYRGKGGAGELGHTVVDPDGPLCDCGHYGCLETYISDKGLMRAAAELQALGELPASIETMDQLIAAAQAGNPAAQGIFVRAGRLLGVQIANLINLYDPDLVVISGEGVRSREWFYGPLRDRHESHVIPGVSGDTEIRIDAWGDDAWARGAASLVLGELFKSPVHQEREVAIAVGEINVRASGTR